MSKFAADNKYLDTLARECAEKDRQRLEMLFNPDVYYLSYGWDEPVLCSTTVMTRPTLTTIFIPTTPNQDNS